jgi:hypothetical protein
VIGILACFGPRKVPSSSCCERNDKTSYSGSVPRTSKPTARHGSGVGSLLGSRLRLRDTTPANRAPRSTHLCIEAFSALRRPLNAPCTQHQRASGQCIQAATHRTTQKPSFRNILHPTGFPIYVLLESLRTSSPGMEQRYVRKAFSATAPRQRCANGPSFRRPECARRNVVRLLAFGGCLGYGEMRLVLCKLYDELRRAVWLRPRARIARAWADRFVEMAMWDEDGVRGDCAIEFGGATEDFILFVRLRTMQCKR